jgi:hypothetical protein
MSRTSTDSATGKKQRFKWIRQLAEAYRITRPNDPQLPFILAATFVVVFGLLLAIGFAIGNPWTFGILGLPLAVLATMALFTRRVQKSAYASVEGQPGAAAAIMNTLGRGWTVAPAVAVTRSQDLVHRATGKVGVVLVGEGRPTGAANLLLAERKRTQRVTGEVPVHEILVGDGEGQVPLKKLSRTISKLPRPLRPAEVTELNRRLKALDNQRGQVPIPKGPLPKGTRMPKMPKA